MHDSQPSAAASALWYGDFLLPSTMFVQWRVTRKKIWERPKPPPKQPDIPRLEGLDVLSLPAFGPFGDLELHRLALLQAAKAARLNGREVHENIFTRLAADEAVALGVVKPLYCSLFH